MPRLIPRADRLVQSVLLHLLPAEVPGVQVGTQKTDVFRRCPFVFVEEVPGGSEPHPALLGIAAVSIECYAKPDKGAAADLAEAVRVALWRAVDEQLVRPEGHLTSYRVESRFVEQREAGQQADVYRYAGQFALGVRLH